MVRIRGARQLANYGSGSAGGSGWTAIRAPGRRPEIQAAEQILVAANANIGAAKAAYFPTITLTGEFGFQSTALANLFSGSRRIWSFIPQLTQPIFTAGLLGSQVEQAEAQQDDGNTGRVITILLPHGRAGADYS